MRERVKKRNHDMFQSQRSQKPSTGIIWSLVFFRCHPVCPPCGQSLSSSPVLLTYHPLTAMSEAVLKADAVNHSPSVRQLPLVLTRLMSMLCTCLDFLVLPVLVTTPFTHLQLKTLNTGHFSKIHCVAPQPASRKLSFSLLSPACHSWIPGNIRLQPQSITLLSDAHPPTLSTAPHSPQYSPFPQ